MNDKVSLVQGKVSSYNTKAFQFPQGVVTFLATAHITKPELFDWKLCLVSEETAVLTRYLVIPQLQLSLERAHELVIPHAHLPLPGDAPPQYVIFAESRDTHQAIPPNPNIAES